MANADQDTTSMLTPTNSKGPPVYTFNPDDDPAQKAAAPQQRTEMLGSMMDNEKGFQERAVSMEQPASPSKPVIPTIQIQNIDNDDDIETPTAAPKKPAVEDITPVVEPQVVTANMMPGEIAVERTPSIPDWYKVGWRQIANVDKLPLAEGEEKDKSVLDQFLSEQYYGSWYHNAAVIVVAVFVSHFFTRFGFGWGWLFILLAACNTYYTTSMSRFRRNARDDIQRELVKTRLMSEHESADWLNHFLDRFWLIYEPVLSTSIVSSVDQVLSTYTPSFLDSLRLSQFTLGTKAPRIDKVRTFPRTDEDIVMMDWAISFTPTDESDMTKRQAETKVNPKIVLSIRVGKGLATAALPVLVEDITFSGLMRIKMKLVSNFPHIQIVDFCFLEKPVIDYVLKPLGGETFGVDIASIPGLSSFIRDTTHSILGPMMYDPNVFTLNLEQLLSGQPLDTSIGVLQVTIHSARGIKGIKIGGGTPDPYVTLSINERAEVARTKWKADTFSPVWMETKYILINNLHERLVLDLYDYNERLSDQKLGTAAFELSALEEDSVREGIVGQVLKDGKDRGEIRFDVSFFPVIAPDAQSDELPDSSVGVVRIVVHQAKDLDTSKSMSGDLNTLAKVYLNRNDQPCFSTPRFKHSNNPVWEAAHEYFCTSKDTDVVTVKVVDDRDFLKDPIVGNMSIRLKDLLEAKIEGGRDWFPLSGCKTGKIRISAQWKPVSMAGSLQGVGQYTPPIGVVRLHLNKAVDVKNVEAGLGGKSDPYVRVQVRNVTKGRTEVINNNLNPVWDQIIYIPVHSLKELLMLECMDYQHLTKDRSLGTVELRLSDLAKATNDPKNPIESTGAQERADPIRLDKKDSTKGTLYYKAQFIPATKLKKVSFDEAIGSLVPHPEGDDGSSVGSEAPGKAFSDRSTSPRIDTAVSSSSNDEATPTTARSTDFSIIDGTGSGSDSAKPGSIHSISKTEPEEGVDMSIDELMAQQSGIIVFRAIGGQIQKKSRLEVLLDDGYWPCFSTEKARSHHAQWDTIGEGFLKEIDFGQVWLRLNDADEGEKDDIIAEWKGDAKEFLQATLRGPQEYTLLDRDMEKPSTIRIEARYIPVPITLEPRETVNNQGMLRVTLLDGHDLRAVDRGGKSDPYVVFTLNDNKVFKSQTKKKTLAPDWNESFETVVPSRVAADFSLEVFDWNQIEQAKSLGEGKIDLINLEPFQAFDQTIPLHTDKHGHKGSIRVTMVFQPMIIAKQRVKTSTFSSAGRALTQVGGAPVNVGKGVFQGVAGVFKRDKDNGTDFLPLGNGAGGGLSIPAGQASHPVGSTAETLTSGLAFPSSESAIPSNDPGTLRVTVMDAKTFSNSEVRPYVTVRLGDKKYDTKYVSKTLAPEWHETFRFACSKDTPKIFLTIMEHKTIGKDKELATGEIDVWRHIKPTGVSGSEVMVELRQGGLLRVRLEFDANSNPSSSRASISSRRSEDHGYSLGRTTSIVSPSRFSIRSKRPSDDD